MIELTDDQMHALESPKATPPRLVNPRTREAFVLLRVDEYERLKDDAYGDSPWTRDELQAVAWETARRAGWEDADEYDDAGGEDVNRGDVVLVRFPHPSGLRGKKRPAVIVQSDAYTGVAGTLVVAEVTSNLTMARDAACLFIGTTTPDGRAWARSGIASCLA